MALRRLSRNRCNGQLNCPLQFPGVGKLWLRGDATRNASSALSAVFGEKPREPVAHQSEALTNVEGNILRGQTNCWHRFCFKVFQRDC